MTVKKEPRWMVLLGPKYLNFLPTYKRLKDMGANDKMIKESLREALYHYVFLKTSKRSEHFFCEYWFIEKRKSFEQIGNEHKLSWERVRQIVEKVKNQFIGK